MGEWMGVGEPGIEPVQEELGLLLEELRGVERAIREMAKKVADRARQVFDRQPAGELVREPSGQAKSRSRSEVEAGGICPRSHGTGTCAGEVGQSLGTLLN